MNKKRHHMLTAFVLSALENLDHYIAASHNKLNYSDEELDGITVTADDIYEIVDEIQKAADFLRETAEEMRETQEVKNDDRY